MQRSKTSNPRNCSESKNTSSSKKSRRKPRRSRSANPKGASPSKASLSSDPAGSGSTAAGVSASGDPASSSVSVSAKEAAVSDNSGFFGFNPAETSGLDDYENIPLDPSNLDLWFLQDTSPLAAGSETGSDASLFEEDPPAPVLTDNSSDSGEQKNIDTPEPELEDDSAEASRGGSISQSRESASGDGLVSQSRESASGSMEDVPGDFDKSDFKYTPDDQLEKAVQNHENDPAADSADKFSDNTFRKRTDTTAAALAGGYASVSSRRRSDAAEAASEGSSANVSSWRRSDAREADSEGSSANVSSRRRSDAAEAASEGSSAGVSSRKKSDAAAAAYESSSANVSSRRRSDETEAAYESSSANVSSRRRSDETEAPAFISDSASAAVNDSVSRRPRAESRAVDSHPASAPLSRSPEQVPEHRKDSDVSYDHSAFREGESLSDDRLPLSLGLIKILFTLIGIIFCLMIVTYFRARLAGEVPNLGILTQILEKHQKEVEITGSADESPNMGPGFDITTGFYGKSIDLFNQSDSEEDNSADTAGQDQAEQTESEDQSSADPAAGNDENSQSQSDGQEVQAAPQETALPETVQQNPVIDNGTADPNTVQQGTGYDNGSGDQTIIDPAGTDPAGTVTQTEETYYDESGQPAAFPEQTYENGTGDGQGTVVEETIVEEDDGGNLDGYYEEGDGYYDDDGYYYEEVPEDEEGEYYEEDEDYDEDEDE